MAGEEQRFNVLSEEVEKKIFQKNSRVDIDIALTMQEYQKYGSTWAERMSKYGTNFTCYDAIRP